MLSFGAGFAISSKKQGISLGFSIHDMALSENKVDLSPQFVISGSKKLKYLPLELYIDLTLKDQSDQTFFFGGEFDIGSSFKFRLGSSTRKFNQNIEKDLFSSIVGASGLGFGYNSQNIFINYGVYIFGTGALTQGIEISINL